MGSGCNSNTTPKCPEDQMTSSNCVLWQGQAYPNLGVCTGDSLTEVGDVILKNLEQFAEGEGFSLKTMTAKCETLEVKLKNTDYSLYSIVKLALDNQCDLQSAIDQLNATVEENKVTIDATKLCPAAETNQEIQQCIIDSIVELKKSLENITTQLGDVTNNSTSITNTITSSIGQFIQANINSCNGGIQKSGTGATAKIDFVGIVPPGGYLWGEFDISKFDSTGMGTDVYCGYALANGRNGTIDMRHRIPSMSSKIQGVTRSFTSLTDVGSVQGSDRITLLASQLPDHEHNIEQTPHSHGYNYQGGTKQVGKNAGNGESAGGTNSLTANTNSANANIEVRGVKGTVGQFIDIRQSTVYQVWIKRVSGFSAINTNQPIVDPGNKVESGTNI